MDKIIREYDDIYKILPKEELNRYLDNFLISNDDFILDVDNIITNGRLSKMNIQERKEYFDNNIGNESRTYIFKILVLKHLSKILYKNLDGFIDEYWREKLKSYEKGECNG